MFECNMNQKKMIEIPVNNYQPLQAVMVKGRYPGKCLVITAGVHGCEYVGVQAARALIKELNPETMSGSVLILPVVNESGFYHGLKQIVAEDGVNLNRAFPGDENGSAAYRIAAAVETYLYPQADFLLDLHSGDVNERLTPLAFFPVAAGEKIAGETREAAKILNVPYRVRSTAKNGLYSWAAQKGIPSILLEYGCQGMWSEKEVTSCKKGVYNLMKHLGILSGEAETDVPERMGDNQTEIETASYYEAASRGFWYPNVKENMHVKAGTLLGELKDICGNTLETFYAEYDAVVMYDTLSLGVSEGDPLVAIGKI